jgi:hypothetical protein
MHSVRKVSGQSFGIGIVVGLGIGLAGVARAKLQCDSNRNVGRQHAATLQSLAIDGQAETVPSQATLPALANLRFKTEFNDYPTMVHVDVYNPTSPPSVRKLHVRIP